MNGKTPFENVNSFAIWMDYKSAIIYRFVENPVFWHKVTSGIDESVKTTGGKASYDPHFSRSISAHKKFHEHHREQLNLFFKEIMTCIPNGSSIVLLGPGVAKSTFKSFIEKHHGNDCCCRGAFASDYLSEAELEKHLKSLHVLLSEVHLADPSQVVPLMRNSKLTIQSNG